MAAHDVRTSSSSPLRRGLASVCASLLSSSKGGNQIVTHRESSECLTHHSTVMDCCDASQLDSLQSSLEFQSIEFWRPRESLHGVHQTLKTSKVLRVDFLTGKQGART